MVKANYCEPVTRAESKKPEHLFAHKVIMGAKFQQVKTDYIIPAVLVRFGFTAYSSVVKREGFFKQGGMVAGFELILFITGLAVTRAYLKASLMGITEIQKAVYCQNFPANTEHQSQRFKPYPGKVINREAR